MMSEGNNQKKINSQIEARITVIEQRMDLFHKSMIDMNTAIDMLVRFSMTAKAFMELSISQGMIDPSELNNLASQYETAYSDNLNISESNTDYQPLFVKNIF